MANMRKAQNRREPEERVEYFSRAIRSWAPPHSRTLLAECYHGRGEARFTQARLEDAESDLSQAVSLDSGGARTRLLRGKVLLRREKTRAALADFTEYRALSGDGQGDYFIGLAHEHAGRLKAAEAGYRKALAANPAGPKPALGLGRVLLLQGRVEPALEWSQRAEEIAGTPQPEALELRAMAREAMGLGAKALEAMDEAVALYRERAAQLKRSAAGVEAMIEAQEDVDRAAARRAALRAATRPAAPAAKPKAPRPKKKKPRKFHSDEGDRVYGS